MKTYRRIKNILILALVFVLFSCSNLFQETASRTPNVSSDSTQDGKTYLVIGNAVIRKTSGASRTILQNYVSDLTDLVLKGTIEDGEEKTLETASSFKELSGAKIPIEAGRWVFSLSAKIGEVQFSGTTENVLIEAGKVNTISFSLTAQDDAFGGIEVKMTFTGEANKVTVTLMDENKSAQIGDPVNLTSSDFTPDDDTPNTYTFIYTRNVSDETARLAKGIYFLKFEFYNTNLVSASGDTNPTLLNTSTNFVHVGNGINTKAELYVELNEIYKITYVDNGGSIAGGATKVENYSRKSCIYLPKMEYSGKVFAGWYASDDFSGTVVKKVESSRGDRTFYARFCDPIIYVNPKSKAIDETTNEYDLFSVEHGCDSLDRALNKIEEYNTPLNWKVYISGELRGRQNISKNMTTDCALTLTLEGMTGSSTDIICAFTEGGNKSEGNAVFVYVPDDSSKVVPVTFKNLTIRDGDASVSETENKGGGIYIAENANVTLENCIITDNSATDGAGVYNNGTLKIAGSTYFSADNDIYLPSGKTVTVASTLNPPAATNGVAAIISPETYGTNTTLVDGSAVGTGHINFAVKDDDATDLKAYLINEYGKIEAKQYTSSGYSEMAAGTDGTGGTTGSYVKFGDWPQTIKSNDVVVYEPAALQVGGNTYYLGSDGAWYAKLAEKARSSNYEYSDGTSPTTNGKTYKYFKVEPIKWRIITTEYDHDDNIATAGKKLLFAENILEKSIFYDDLNNRSIGGVTIYANNYEYSRMRAFLNGTSYALDDANSNDELVGKGFLQTAFSATAQNDILETNVYNNSESANPNGSSVWTSYVADYVYNNPTLDKVFLLSTKEITTEGYGFQKYKQSGTTDSARVRTLTDYAIASGVQKPSTGGYYWLRSPYYDDNGQRIVYPNGNGELPFGTKVDNSENTACGFVPALCLEQATPSYTVTFDTDTANGGSAVASQTVEYYQTATEPTQPTRTGYTFSGWYSNSDCTTSFDFSNPITSNTTVYAKWTVNVGINISFTAVSTSGDISVTDSVSGGKATYTAPTGYSQYSWSLDGTQITSTSTSSNSYVSGTNGNVLTITLSSLANGSHDVYVEVKDSNGNYSSWSGQYTKN